MSTFYLFTIFSSAKTRPIQLVINQNNAVAGGPFLVMTGFILVGER
jgi:hypothetical protein